MDLVFQLEDDGFSFGDHFIRLVRSFTTEAGTTEDIGFVATDLAKALEIQRTSNLTDRLDPDQKGAAQIGTLGGIQSLGVVSESGFYDGVVRSDKPQGKVLRALVTREILPRLRKTGSYSVAPAAPPAAAIAGQSQDITASYLLMAGAMEKIGVEAGIALAAAFDSIKKVTNLPVEDMRRKLPAPKNDPPTLNPTQVGDLLNISAKAVNNRLIEKGYQIRTKSGNYLLTEEGQAFGALVPYSKNGHAGYQVLWLPKVAEKIGQT
jgi:prophage antirepressor-like protein